jgi:hypothetical protein
MNQMAFTYTRARSTDPTTSRAAAKTAASGKAADLRRTLQSELQIRHVYGLGGQTARELSASIHADYYDVQRRLSETANIRKTGEVRDGAMVWEWHAEGSAE